MSIHVRLCDDRGMVSDERVPAGAPGTLLDPELTYRKLVNNLRAQTGLPPVEEFHCTGSAHLAREVFVCISPAHRDPERETVLAELVDVLQKGWAGPNTRGWNEEDWRHNAEYFLPVVQRAIDRDRATRPLTTVQYVLGPPPGPPNPPRAPHDHPVG